MKWMLAATLSLLGLAASAGLLVTEVIGKAEILGKGDVVTLAEITDGARLSLLAGAQLIAVDLGSGQEFVLKGSGDFVVTPDGPKTVDGKAIEAKSLPAKNLPYVRDTRIARGSVSQASLVMRSIHKGKVPLLVFPVRTAIITQAPIFRWNPVEAVSGYRLVLVKHDRAPIWDVSTRETEMALPLELKLVPGGRYVWRVEAIGEDGILSDASASFSVAQADAIERLSQLEPGLDAPFGRRVLYAAQLREVGAVAQAKEIWQALSREHPQDEIIRILAE